MTNDDLERMELPPVPEPAFMLPGELPAWGLATLQAYARAAIFADRQRRHVDSDNTSAGCVKESAESGHEDCPFCGGTVDPQGWLGGDGKRGPECEDCGATAPSLEAWNRRQVRAQAEPEANEREAIARAIWSIRREEEDRCDMELEDMRRDHSVWAEADAVMQALRSIARQVGTVERAQAAEPVAWRTSKDGELWPRIGEKYIIRLRGVLQHEIYEFDQGDDGFGSGDYFWSRDDVDECPLFDHERDEWLPLSELDSPTRPAPAEVSEEMVRRAHAEYHAVLGSKDRSDPMRAALEAALGGGKC